MEPARLLLPESRDGHDLDQINREADIGTAGSGASDYKKKSRFSNFGHRFFSSLFMLIFVVVVLFIGSPLLEIVAFIIGGVMIFECNRLCA